MIFVEETFRSLVQAVREGDVKVLLPPSLRVRCDVKDPIGCPFR